MTTIEKLIQTMENSSLSNYSKDEILQDLDNLLSDERHDLEMAYISGQTDVLDSLEKGVPTTKSKDWFNRSQSLLT